MKELGYAKEEDYLQMKVEVKEIPEKIKEVSQYISKKYGIKPKKFKNEEDISKYAE